MKKVVSGTELKDKMKYAINLLCDTVKSTLGPVGSNIIIDHSTFSPFITNDGVTIASNIESEDEVINTILELAKESSIKTNETVGDGTTTTLVFLQSIFNDGISKIEKGTNPIILKESLKESLNKVIDKLNELSHNPSDEELTNIAKISSNSEDIGNIIGEVYLKLKNKNAIKIIEGNSNKIEYLNGYQIDTNIASNLFFKDYKEINYNNSNIIISNTILEDINDISEIINKIIKDKEPLIIISEYSDNFINQILSMNIELNTEICLLIPVEYGDKKINVLKDICAISNCKIINNKINLDYMGKVKNIKINRETTTFNYEENSNIKNRINEIINNEYSNDLEFLNKRISMFEYGLANIYISAPTITERRELKMRYDDALCAIDSAKDGVVIGSGVTLLNIKDNVKIDSIGDEILYNALEKPFNQIMINSGIDYKSAIEEIKKYNYKKVYNIKTFSYESSTVMDSTNVIKNSLINAVSIASMLLTTTSLVINEYKNELCKTNDYNEL